MKPKQYLLLPIFLLASFGAAAIGGLATSGSVNTWYQEIARPTWTPPDFLFGPVWTVLYILIGIAGWLAFSRGAARPRLRAWAMTAFAAQLLANALWSIFFFGLQSPFLALLDIALLWVLIGATLLLFRPLSPASALLLLPYWLWVGFAAVLNAAIWAMNR